MLNFKVILLEMVETVKIVLVGTKGGNLILLGCILFIYLAALIVDLSYSKLNLRKVILELVIVIID